MVQKQDEVSEVPDGRVLSGDVVEVRLAVGDLVEHLLEEHVETRVFLDGVLELLQDRHELLGRVSVYMLDGLVEVGVLVSLVLGEPLPGPGCVVLVGDRVVALVHAGRKCSSMLYM